MPTTTPFSRQNASVGPYTFDRVIPLRQDLTLELAQGLVSKNGYDEVLLRTASGKLFAAVGPGGRLDLRPGYVGKVNGEQATVVHVDDEVNSAKEGARAPFRTVGNLLQTTGSTAMTAMVSTAVGGSLAAAAAAGATAEVGRKGLGHLAKTTQGAFSVAAQRFVVTGAVGLAVAAVALGAWSAIGAIRGANIKGKDVTLEMLR